MKELRDLKDLTIHDVQPIPPALRVGSSFFFSSLGLYWRSPESGDLWYKSRQLIKTIYPPPFTGKFHGEGQNSPVKNWGGHFDGDKKSTGTELEFEETWFIQTPYLYWLFRNSMQTKDFSSQNWLFSQACPRFIQAELVLSGGCEVSANEQPSEGEQIVLFNCLDLYHKSPDSGELQYKSTSYKRRFDPALRAGPLPREEGTTTKVVRTFTWK